ncbi:MAG: glycosyltransferase family 39 protein [Candidatus Woesearchaeota archaeon]
MIPGWFKQKNNLVFVGIVLFALAIRLYYFILTNNQPVWWDEAEYLSTAKHWAMGIPYDINPQRPVLLPLLETIILFLGGGEGIIRFFLVLIPSIGVVIVSYLLGKEMFNKKIGLITSAIMGGFWLLLFNTVRMHVEAMLMFFVYLSIFCFWKGFVKENSKYKLLTGLFLGLGFLTKFTASLTVFSLLLFLFVIKRFKMFKDKYFWLSGLIAFITILPHLIWSKINFGSFFIFLSAGAPAVSSLIGGEKISAPFGWHILGNVSHFTQLLFFVFFFIGLLTLYKLFLGFDLIIKNKSKELYAHFFSIIFILINLAFYIFILRVAEDRWLLPIALPIFFFIALGLILLYNLLIKFKIPKIIGLISIITILSIGIYSQISFADEIIKSKKETYLPVKQAALWMKENSKESDTIISASNPQTVYYAERKVIGFGPQANLSNALEEIRPKFMVLSVFEQYPEWTYRLPEENKETFVPVQVYSDQNQKPLLVIYEVRY